MMEFQIELFNRIFDSIQARTPEFDFGDLTWDDIRRLTEEHARRKDHIQLEGFTKEQFLTRLIKIQVQARKRYALWKHTLRGRVCGNSIVS